jgi:hypothetical protein
MMTEQLRRWSDKVDSRMVRRWSDKAGDSLKATGEAARSGLDSVYTQVRSHPKATVAVVVGSTVAAALLWLANRNGTVQRRVRSNGNRRIRSSNRRSRSAR